MGFLDSIFNKNNLTTQSLVSTNIAKKSEVKRTETKKSKVITTQKGAKELENNPLEDITNIGENNAVANKTIFFKRTVEKKLTIILIENTFEVVKEKENLLKIIKSIVTEGLVSVIRYGSSINRSEIFEVSNIDTFTLVSNYSSDSRYRLYDALVDLEKLVSEQYMSIEEKENERIRINKIEVIGIGTCNDKGSNATKEIAIDSFCKVLAKSEVVSKYFCLTEKTFMDAAEIGFRSIGAIHRNYL